MIDLGGALYDLIAENNVNEACDMLVTIAGENAEIIYNYLADEIANGAEKGPITWVFVMNDRDTINLPYTIEYAGAHNNLYFTVAHKLIEYLNGDVQNETIKLKKLG